MYWIKYLFQGIKICKNKANFNQIQITDVYSNNCEINFIPFLMFDGHIKSNVIGVYKSPTVKVRLALCIIAEKLRFTLYFYPVMALFFLVVCMDFWCMNSDPCALTIFSQWPMVNFRIMYRHKIRRNNNC